MIMILYMINHSGKMNNFATIFDIHSRVTHNFINKLCVASDPKLVAPIAVEIIRI